MKVSVLLPSLFPKLADRIIRQLWASVKPKGISLEIVVCSPFHACGEGIVWCEEKEPKGTNPAMRKAFEASSGDLVCSLADDFGVDPFWIGTSVSDLGNRDEIVLAMDGGGFSCFGYRYAISQMTTRRTVENHWKFFFPYISHWGDPAFSMDVWRSGGSVVRPSQRVVHWGLDRMGCGESGIKESSMELDKQSFLRDFAHMGVGYDLSGDWHAYNGVYPCKYD